MASNFRVDVVLNSVKSLQQERACLEQKLHELRRKRAALEKGRDSIRTKLNQSKDVNMKMNETLKVAEHKVAETQAQLQKHKESGESLKEKLTKQESEISQMKSEQMDETMHFEMLLSKMATQFQSARDYHKDVNLSSLVTEIDTSQRNDSNLNEERDQLTRDLEKLRLDSEDSRQKADEFTISPSDQRQVLLGSATRLQALCLAHTECEEKLQTLQQTLA